MKKIKINKNIERYIYIGDTHGTKNLREFIDKYNDGKTFFYFLGDIFDRGHFSYYNFLIIQELHIKGLASMILGNHDLFFIFSKGIIYNGDIKKLIYKGNKRLNFENFSKVVNYHKERYFFSGGEQTDQSFYDYLEIDTNEQISESDKQRVEDLYSATANYLWKNFDISMIDHSNNILVHGGIPILPAGDLVSVEIGGEFYKGIKLLEKISEGIHNLDYEIIIKADPGIESGESDSILSKMKRFGDNIKTGNDILNYASSRYISPTWYDNSMYDKNEVVRNTLINELNENGINNIFLGHWHNKEISNSKFNNKDNKYWEYNRVFRLDRSHILTRLGDRGSIGYSIFNKNNELLETGTFNNERK